MTYLHSAALALAMVFFYLWAKKYRECEALRVDNTRLRVIVNARCLLTPKALDKVLRESRLLDKAHKELGV